MSSVFANFEFDTNNTSEQSWDRGLLTSVKAKPKKFILQLHDFTEDGVVLQKIAICKIKSILMGYEMTYHALRSQSALHQISNSDGAHKG